MDLAGKILSGIGAGFNKVGLNVIGRFFERMAQIAVAGKPRAAQAGSSDDIKGQDLSQRVATAATNPPSIFELAPGRLSSVERIKLGIERAGSKATVSVEITSRDQLVRLEEAIQDLGDNFIGKINLDLCGMLSAEDGKVFSDHEIKQKEDQWITDNKKDFPALVASLGKLDLGYTPDIGQVRPL